MSKYLVARWPGEPRDRVVDPIFLREAQEQASFWALVVAHSRAHALRLVREGAEAVTGIDDRLERCGIVRKRERL